ncbi:MAG: hypothetical protein ACLTT1_17025 [[Clostridium] scindens]
MKNVLRMKPGRRGGNQRRQQA